MEHGDNVAFPKVPKKDGFVGKWDRNNENITSDIVINAVYTEIDNVVPDDLKTDDKSELEDTKKQLEDMLGDNSNMFLWIALLFISGGAIITLTIVERKKRAK